ncbi:molecular chaperone DnaJ [Prauserella sp. PE36]|uniref:J domain-containing protein n=1 Tax=Prauserella endophytica TaxID=1592324 RepID=A0ABY2S9Y4_9PSEU|nr:MULTISPECIES: DnaJ domain-containing protein [Prauserella]PXY23107.1 hypothetical protein BAY59_25675 [Prauserella coralliicola]RBM17135.1 molecular chaperone DnaJ [Prauserella sp. PE36]TKG72501.1 J domain-containing protein [Prauserella endophytica]
MSSIPSDPHTVLGLEPGAGTAEITTAYRRAVRACHPDGPQPDPERLAAVLAAYRLLRDRNTRRQREHQRTGHGQEIPVRVHPHVTPSGPALRAGPVRHHRRGTAVT